MNTKVVGKAVVVMSDDVKMPVYGAPKENPVKQEEKSAEIKKEGNTIIFKNITELKDFKGKELGISNWQTLSQEMINDFAKATFDDQWIHVNEEMAKQFSPFGKTIAHGFLSLSLSPKFMYEMFKVESARMGLNYGTNKVRFISPVPSGSRVRMKAVLKGSRRHAAKWREIDN